jgi:cobalamin synthase
MEKLDFSKEQKEEYRKLKITIILIGVPGFVTGTVLRLLGFLEIADLTVSFLLLFLSLYVYRRYRKILIRGKPTKAYAEFQREMYMKILKLFSLFLIPYSLFVIYLVFFYTDLLAQNPILVILLIVAPAIFFGFLAMSYEQKRFGTLKRAP